MTFYDQQTGQTPTGGNIPFPIAGTAFVTSQSLAANASIASGWIATRGFGSLLFVIRSDKAGSVMVEYSDDGVNPIQAGSPLQYTELNQQVQRVLVPKATYTRVTYTNGAAAQTNFRLEVRLSPSLIQPTESSLNAGLTGTELSMVTADVIFMQDSTGAYDQPTRTGSSQNVNVTNGVNFSQPANATTTQLTTLATTTTVLPANVNRRGATFNSVSGTILIKLGAGASVTSYSVRLVTNGYYELPESGYTGIITAVGAGTLMVTEITV